MRNRTISVVTLALVLCIGSMRAVAGSYTEKADAGNLISTTQVTAGTGSLSAINGTLTDSTDLADLFKIFITGGGTFSATTVGSEPLDSSLFLFDASGFGVYANDDVSGFLAPATLPAGDPLTPTAPGFYYLLVTQCCAFPTSVGGEIFQTQEDHNAVSGPTGPGGGSPFTGLDTSFIDQFPGGGSYTITLTGAEFATESTTVPEPSTLILLGSGLLGALGVMRRKRPVS